MVTTSKRVRSWQSFACVQNYLECLLHAICALPIIINSAVTNPYCNPIILHAPKLVPLSFYHSLTLYIHTREMKQLTLHQSSCLVKKLVKNNRRFRVKIIWRIFFLYASQIFGWVSGASRIL